MMTSSVTGLPQELGSRLGFEKKMMLNQNTLAKFLTLFIKESMHTHNIYRSMQYLVNRTYAITIFTYFKLYHSVFSELTLLNIEFREPELLNSRDFIPMTFFKYCPSIGLFIRVHGKQFNHLLPDKSCDAGVLYFLYFLLVR